MASPASTPPPPDPPSALPLPLPLPLPVQPPSRRLPPPCWSPDETLALIDAYRDKWYSLGRGNLKATHWQEVADAVAHRCPNASPPKTPVQCRHKMEKLRKRYRTEIQRSRTLPVSRFNSSWVHFKLMDSMEKGPSPLKPDIDSDSHDDDPDLYDDIDKSNTRSLNKLYRNGANSGGFRIRIPTGFGVAQPTNTKPYAKASIQHNPIPNPIPKKRDRDPVGEVVSAIKILGDGFVRMEQMKMEMAREIESMRMEMEMKRTEMILQSQQRIVDAFANALSDKKKKPKRIPSPQQP